MLFRSMAHINEHLGFEYRKQIEQQLGMALPAQKDEAGEEVNMDPEVEARLAPMLAQAAQRLLQQNTQQVQAAQAQQQAQDPIVQMQMQELQIKQAEQQRKAQKDQADIALKAAQLEIEKQRIASQAQTEDKRTRMDMMKTAAVMANDRQTKMGEVAVDVLKHLSNKNAEEQLRAMQERMQARQQKGKQPETKGE